MVEAKEYNCNEYIHVHVIPKDNTLLRLAITSPKLPSSVVAEGMCETWSNLLKEPNRYMVKDPKDLLQPLEQEKDTNSLLRYLEERYWNLSSTVNMGETISVGKEPQGENLSTAMLDENKNFICLYQKGDFRKLVFFDKEGNEVSSMSASVALSEIRSGGFDKYTYLIPEIFIFGQLADSVIKGKF